MVACGKRVGNTFVDSDVPMRDDAILAKDSLSADPLKIQCPQTRKRIKDTGELGYSDIEKAIEKVDGIENDIPQGQPLPLPDAKSTQSPEDG